MIYDRFTYFRLNTFYIYITLTYGECPVDQRSAIERDKFNGKVLHRFAILATINVSIIAISLSRFIRAHERISSTSYRTLCISTYIFKYILQSNPQNRYMTASRSREKWEKCARYIGRSMQIFYINNFDDIWYRSIQMRHLVRVHTHYIQRTRIFVSNNINKLGYRRYRSFRGYAAERRKMMILR